MSKKNLIIFITLLVVGLFMATSNFAETIALKSGKVREGKIIERTDEYIKVELFGVPITYFLEDIESIDGEKIMPAQKEEIPVSSEDAEQLAISGFTLMEQGKYPQAETELKRAIQLDPKLSQAYYALGSLYFTWTGRLQDAISVYTEGISKIPSDKRLYYALATAYLKSGEWDNCEKTLREVLSMYPDYAEAQKSLEHLQDLKRRNVSKIAVAQQLQAHDRYPPADQRKKLSAGPDKSFLDQLNPEEIAAVTDLRTLYAACESYKEVYQTYPESLKVMAEEQPPFISEKLGEGRGAMSDYRFDYSFKDKDNFEIVASSSLPNRNLYIDKSGNIKLINEVEYE